MLRFSDGPNFATVALSGFALTLCPACPQPDPLEQTVSLVVEDLTREVNEYQALVKEWLVMDDETAESCAMMDRSYQASQELYFQVHELCRHIISEYPDIPRSSLCVEGNFSADPKENARLLSELHQINLQSVKDAISANDPVSAIGILDGWLD